MKFVRIVKSNYGEGMFLAANIQQLACDQSEVKQGKENFLNAKDEGM